MYMSADGCGSFKILCMARLFIYLFVCLFCSHTSSEVSYICGELNTWSLGCGPPLPVRAFSMKFCSGIQSGPSSLLVHAWLCFFILPLLTFLFNICHVSCK